MVIPSHSDCSHNCNKPSELTMLPIASPTKTITKQTRMSAKVRATLSRKLNVRAYKSNENAVIAIPAVSSWLKNFKLDNNAPIIINHQIILNLHNDCNRHRKLQFLFTSLVFTSNSWKKTEQYHDWENNDRYIRKDHTPVFEPYKLKGSFSAAFPLPSEDS